jgi:hypothetical protein
MGTSATVVGGDRDYRASTMGQSRAAIQFVENSSRWPRDAYEFVSMRREGDALDVTVRHGGGCADHQFALLVHPAFRESYPVQMGGVVAHDAKGDPCRALVQKTLEFDLSPVKQASRRAYQTETGAVRIDVVGWPRPIEYTF